MVETWTEEWEEEIPYVFPGAREEAADAQTVRIPMVVEVQEQGEETETGAAGEQGAQRAARPDVAEAGGQAGRRGHSQAIREAASPSVPAARQAEEQGAVEASIPVRWLQRETEGIDSWDGLQGERKPLPSQFPEWTVGRAQEPQPRQTIEASVWVQNQAKPAPPMSPARKWGTPVFVLGIVILVLTVAVLIASRSHSNPVARPSDGQKRVGR